MTTRFPTSDNIKEAILRAAGDVPADDFKEAFWLISHNVKEADIVEENSAENEHFSFLYDNEVVLKRIYQTKNIDKWRTYQQSIESLTGVERATLHMQALHYANDAQRPRNRTLVGAHILCDLAEFEPKTADDNFAIAKVYCSLIDHFAADPHGSAALERIAQKANTGNPIVGLACLAKNATMSQYGFDHANVSLSKAARSKAPYKG